MQEMGYGFGAGSVDWLQNGGVDSGMEVLALITVIGVVE